MRSLIIIPARYESERLPGKPLLQAGGKALVHWTYESAKRTKADNVVVTSDSREVGRYCAEHDITFWPSAPCRNGTERCATVVGQLRPEVRDEIDVVINWQVDWPWVNPADVDLLIDDFRESGCLHVWTIVAARPRTGCVRVAVDRDNECHWFSRAAMAGSLGHVGVYAFSPPLLREIGYLTPSRLAIAESLEQLTWIANGYRIEAIEVADCPPSIDTEADWREFKQMIEPDPAFVKASLEAYAAGRYKTTDELIAELRSRDAD